MKYLLSLKRQERHQRYDRVLIGVLVFALSLLSMLIGIGLMVVVDNEAGLMVAPFLVLALRGPMNSFHKRRTAKHLDRLVKEELAEAIPRNL